MVQGSALIPFWAGLTRTSGVQVGEFIVENFGLFGCHYWGSGGSEVAISIDSLWQLAVWRDEGIRRHGGSTDRTGTADDRQQVRHSRWHVQLLLHLLLQRSRFPHPPSSFPLHLPQIRESSSTYFHPNPWSFHNWPPRVFGYSGISYSSATLATTILNLIPGFTFVLAILCRMEAANIGSSTTQAKIIGTVVSIGGAILVTLYKGPPIIPSLLKSEISKHLLVQPSNWVLGGVFLAIDCAFSSMYIISQAFVLKKYPAVMIVMFSYCFVCTILSVITSLIVEADLSSFSLQPKKRLLSVLYSGIFGSAFQVTVQAWCIQRKGPLFVAMFHPLGIVISTLIGVIFLGDGFYLGSLVGSIVVVIGFYTVMWGKAKEQIEAADKGGSSKLHNEGAPLLQDNVEEQTTSLSP
ncbi:hypothetical protein OSB04_021652 [Centaurea solstitialis]|uniref:WAT1-related protein n=1 Tax=Centaurea solstitialis TaxID=347529 RepID=A0AA38WGG1_9ASTR|nr:hypothetical protein OSB04_021652 [Centaurea solstitialis]